MPASAQESSRCPKLSDVEWWTNTIPEVRRVVTASYNGNWESYIDRWIEQRRDLLVAYNAGNSVEIKSRALVFRDDDLKDYIAQVDERIKTLECLKKEYPSDANPQAPVRQPLAQDLPPAQKVEAVEGKELSVEVAALCDGKIATFQITNLGELWPRLAEVSIYRTDTNSKVTQRRLRMTNSQQMIFKVPDASKDAGEIGIFIEPAWYDRSFKYDATIKC